MRPLFFEWPHDPGVWSAPVEWLLGDDLLVAPVLEPGATEWTVYLPEGEWADAWSGERHSGGSSITVETPSDRIPLFVRGSAGEELRSVFRDEAGPI